VIYGGVGPDVSSVRLSRAELLTRYGAYRRRQARALLHLMPREGVRPLYRRALRDGLEGEAHSDPMDALVAYCETLLPLPPFEVWCEDVRRNPDAYDGDGDGDDIAVAPTSEAPLTRASREFTHGDRRWTAHLRSYRDESGWRGFIAFEDPLTTRVHRTASIFHESCAEDVHERFASFESSALAAFLRSALS
jgi:hypothetical protein